MMITLRYIALYLFVFQVIFISCSDEEILMSDYVSVRGETTVFSKVQTDLQSVPKEISEYYNHLANMARWYARHPEARSIKYPSTLITCHPFLTKLDHLVLSDTLGNCYSFFDLPESEQESFLECWKVIESGFLATKLRKSPEKRPLERFILRNSILSTFSVDLKSSSLFTKDPYIRIKTLMEEQSGGFSTNFETGKNMSDEENSDEDFWKTAIRNYHASYSIIQSAPLQLSAQTFVERIRPMIRKGRLLIALPGGWTTHSLLVVYPHREFFDVGHVALFTKDDRELEDTLTGESCFTIGTSLMYDTNLEKIGQSWLQKHGLAFVGQICSVVWRARSDGDGSIKWDKEMTDADNEAIWREAIRHEGIPYCRVADVFFSKKAAPESFICSSLAWYACREATGIEIGDWLSESIYPVDVLFSENVKIIDDTLE